jgi:hypothetical protein
MLKKALRYFALLVFIAATSSAMIIGAYKSTQKSLMFPTAVSINKLTNVGNSLSAAQARAVIKSRQSAVQVMSLDVNDGGISVSSGTYIVYDDKHLVLTTSHGIGEICALTQIIVDDNLHNCVTYVLRDPQTDYIIIQIEPLKSRQPVRIPEDIPHRLQWRRELGTQNMVFYTGFPNQGGPYTFDGKIVGYNEEEALFIDSYGWSGSSGSGVFSAQGNLLGYIMALEVGETYFGREVLENFIWVIPLFKVNWRAATAFAD